MKNKYYSIHDKEKIINLMLLNNKTINSVVIDEDFASRGMLQNWLRDYKDIGYNIVERKRGESLIISKK